MSFKDDIDLLVRQNEALIQTLANAGLRIESSIKMLSAISSLTSLPIREVTMDGALDQVLEVLLKNLSDVEGCSLLLYDPETDSLRLRAAKGQAEMFGDPRGPYNTRLSFRSGEGVAGRVFRDQRPVFWDENSGPEMLKRDPDMTEPVSLACLPLSLPDRPTGVLNISFGQVRPFDYPRQRDLIVLSEVVANIVQTFALRSELAEQAESLRQARDELERRVRRRTAERDEAADRLRREMLARDAASQTLREHEERFRLIVTNSPDVAFFQDHERRYTWAVGEGGFFGENPVGRRDEDLFKPPDAAQLAEAKSRAAESEGGVRTIIDLEVAGEKRWFDLSLVPRAEFEGGRMGLAGFARDITDRKVAAETLRANEERLRIVTENAPDVIMQVDRDGCIAFINHDVGGFSADELTGASFVQWADPDYRTALQVAMEQVLTDGKPRTYECRAGGSEEKWYSGRMAPVVLDGEIDSVIAIARDVSAAKRDEAEKVKLESHLQQVHKLEALGTLAGGIAHDFNNILSAIMGYAQLMEEDLDPESKSALHLQKLLGAGLRARDLARQILTFSRRQEPEIQVIRVSDVVSEAVDLLRASLPATIDINTELDLEWDLVSADPGQIHQVILNLGANAGQAMNNHGGRLDIRLLREDVAPNQGLAAGLSPGSYLVIEIADTGPGIPEDVRDRVFDPFFTTKPRGEGTGMGLAVAIGIAKKHGGDLRLAENSEAGTAFRLYLPVHHGSGPPAETPGAKGMPAGTEKVLVVDDEEALVDVIGEALTRLGYRVEPCRSPDEALQCLRTDPEAYDLVVTDHIMPVMTGAELGREINALRPDLPMILCSGHGEAVDRSRAEEWGFAAFMRKPVRVEDLARLVREVLDRPDA